MGTFSDNIRLTENVNLSCDDRPFKSSNSVFQNIILFLGPPLGMLSTHLMITLKFLCYENETGVLYFESPVEKISQCFVANDIKRKKRRDLTLSYNIKTYTHRKIQKAA